MKWIIPIVITSLIITSAYAGFGRGGFSGSSRGSGYTRSYSYSAPRPVYRSPPVVHHYYPSTIHHGSGFGSSFVGGMAGAVVGNALSRPSTTVVAPGAVQPVIPVTSEVATPPVVYMQPQHGILFYACIVLFGLLGITVVYRLLLRS